jgi:pimeloyl-ACP methyl ester carboxylesterase
MPVLRRVSRFTRACVYDRAGLGWSDPAPPGRNFEQRASDLHRLLVKADIGGPFVLVGGSLGGLITRTYARLYPKEVAGLVLVDSAEEAHWFPMMVGRRDQNERTLLDNAKLAVDGTMRRNMEASKQRSPWYEGKEHDWLVDILSSPRHWRAAADEVTAFDRTPQAQRKAGGFGTLGNRPLIVLSHGQPFTGNDADVEKGWTEGQQRLIELSKNSLQIIATKNGHTISAQNHL